MWFFSRTFSLDSSFFKTQMRHFLLILKLEIHHFYIFTYKKVHSVSVNEKDFFLISEQSVVYAVRLKLSNNITATIRERSQYFPT